MAEGFSHPGVFWGCEVREEDVVRLPCVNAAFYLTAAVLGPGSEGSGRSVLLVKVGGTPAIVLATLTDGKVENASINLHFPVGSDVTFSVKGAGVVHLSGFVEEDDDHDHYLMGDSTEGKVFLEEGEDEEEDIARELAKFMQEEEASEKKVHKKRKKEEKKEKKQEDKKEKNEPEKKRKAKVSVNVSEEQIHSVRVGRNEIKFINLSHGKGKAAGNGRKVRIKYTGRLAENNRIFDTSGNKCINFMVGKGEVIKGLDVGIKGMMPGGKRKIFIPSELAYGEMGAPPDIPPNSSLVFEIELVSYGVAKKKKRNQKRQSSPPRFN